MKDERKTSDEKMRHLPVLFALASCGAPFSADLFPSDAAPEAVGSPTPDAGRDAFASVEASIESGFVDAREEPEATMEATVEASPPMEAGQEATTCSATFPDGGYACGGTWVQDQDTYLCVSHAGSETTLSPPGAFCAQSGCLSCATCDGVAICAALNASYVGCAETNGQPTFSCSP